MAVAVLVCKHAVFGQLLVLPEKQQDPFSAEGHRYVSLLNTHQHPNADSRIDVTYYRLNLHITTSPNFLRGVVTLKAISKVDQLATLSLDLTNTLTVDSIKMENVNVQFVQHPTTVSIELNRSYGFGQMVVLDVYYQGIPQGTGFGSFVFGGHGSTPWVWTLSQPYGSRDWWPSKDHPIDKADSVDIHVTCRQDFKVASNGKLVSITQNPDNTHTYFWSTRYPIATYLVFVSLTNYAEFTDWYRYSPTDSMPVLNYVLPQHLTQARDSLSKVLPMLDIFSDRFGPYPFLNEKYGHAQFGSGGAMEHQTMTSLTLAAFEEYVLAHELAHQWFGDLITCANWQHLWLNEGFASYGESIYAEGRYGIQQYRNRMHETMTTAKRAVGPLVKIDTSVVRTLFDQPTVYRKGASVLHMLRRVLGDSVFFHALKSYAADPRLSFGVALSEDFQFVCETVSQQSLGWFFQQWLYGEKYPTYSFSWSSVQRSNGYEVTVNLSQSTGTANPAFFTMPVDFRFSTDDRDTTVTFFNDANPQQFSAILSRRPAKVELDPDNWILRDIRTNPAIPVDFRLRPNYPNPFNGSTVIEYEVPRAAFITLAVFNLLGQQVRTLVNEPVYPGLHRTTFEADGLPSGVYYYRLQAGQTFRTRTAVVIR